MRNQEHHAYLIFDNPDGDITLKVTRRIRRGARLGHYTENYYPVSSERAEIILRAMWNHAQDSQRSIYTPCYPRIFVHTQVWNLQSVSGDWIPCNVSRVQFSV